MCVCVCVCMSKGICVHAWLCGVCMHVGEGIQVLTWVCVYVCVHACACSFVYIWLCVSMHCIGICVYTHVCMYSYFCTCVCACSRFQIHILVILCFTMVCTRWKYYSSWNPVSSTSQNHSMTASHGPVINSRITTTTLLYNYYLTSQQIMWAILN